MIKWMLQEIPIKDLKQHPKNPRMITSRRLDQLTANIDEFGLIDKPIVNQDLTIIGGHQRIRIFKKKKVKTIECWIPDSKLTEKQVDKLCIKLNLDQGRWDYDIMANEWDPLDLLEAGFSEDELVGNYEQVKKELTSTGEKEEKASNKKKKSCPNCGHEF